MWGIVLSAGPLSLYLAFLTMFIPVLPHSKDGKEEKVQE